MFESESNSSIEIENIEMRKSKWAPAQVYSLKLRGGKKYVGMTKPGPIIHGKTPLDRRLQQHFNGSGAKWT